ncbi:MAG TPA: NlpC/P60 family protein [Eubacteriales bacterium]|nr:NlpC/P60 family protein [Clostridia bacterium]HRV73803.1 NlpC/P60 family protein [Eubacteriales bacterium]
MTATVRRLICAALVLLTAAELCVLGALVALGSRTLSDRPLTMLTTEAIPYLRQDMGYVAERVALNEELSEDRQTVVNAALSIVDEVGYFWGGKSFCIGKDPLWGAPTEVTSHGSDSTGTIQPFGLDCSGYISWCFIQTVMSFDDMVESVGNGSSNQWDRTYAIGWTELIPGDLVFQYDPAAGLGNHVGIVVGFAEDGEPLIAHCGYTLQGAAVSGRGDIFTIPRRPNFYGD